VRGTVFAAFTTAGGFDFGVFAGTLTAGGVGFGVFAGTPTAGAGAVGARLVEIAGGGVAIGRGVSSGGLLAFHVGFDSGFFAGTLTAGGTTFGAGDRGSSPEDRGSFPGFPALGSRPSILDAEGGTLTAGFGAGAGALTAGRDDFGADAGALTAGGVDLGAGAGRFTAGGLNVGFDSGFFAGTLTAGGAGVGTLTAGGADLGAGSGMPTAGGCTRGSGVEVRGLFWGCPISDPRPSTLDAEVDTLAAGGSCAGGRVFTYHP
jgi:hypothetical protein